MRGQIPACTRGADFPFSPPRPPRTSLRGLSGSRKPRRAYCPPFSRPLPIEIGVTSPLPGVPSLFHDKEGHLMFRKLINTTNDPAITVLRLILGVVFFAHGAQKTLGWFGGYGFSGTMGFFTQQAHIPAALAFLAICAEFLGGIGFVLGLLRPLAPFRIPRNMGVHNTKVHRPIAFFSN